MYDLEEDTQREVLLPTGDFSEKINQAFSKTSSLRFWKWIASVIAAAALVFFIQTKPNRSIEFTLPVLKNEMQTEFHRIDSSLPPIPPIHPHHTGVVTYSSQMDSDGSISYRRDIEAPCEHGMLLFSVGPAKDDLPYKYDIYEDAYLYSDNGGLCIFYPTYTGFQISSEPWWTPTDPMRIDIKPLDKSKMHWISSRVVNPHKSKKTVDEKIAGDYVIIAKHDFYTPHYYQALKATVNSWK